MVARAAGAGLDAIALTDHDTTDGVAEAAAALPRGLALVPGMELSCRREGHSVHLLAYLFDPAHRGLARECERIRASRVDRAKAVVAVLAALGVPVTWDQVEAIAGGGVVGRPHIARAMVAAGVIDSAEQAFTPQWIGPGGRAHVRRYALDPADAVRLVRAAGGVSVLAHPLASTRGWTVPDALLGELAAAGLDGVEVDHPDHDGARREALRAAAGRLGLAGTGGSDDHGELTGDRIGCETTSAAVFDLLVAAATGAVVVSR